MDVSGNRFAEISSDSDFWNVTRPFRATEIGNKNIVYNIKLRMVIL